MNRSRQYGRAVIALAAVSSLVAGAIGAAYAPGAPPQVNESVSPLTGGKVIAGTRRGDRLRGGVKADFVAGSGGRDDINGRGDHDELSGGPGVDLVIGGTGHDFILGGPGADHLRGGPGNDEIVDHAGATAVQAARGTEYIDVYDRKPDDRVACGNTARGTIYANRGDELAGCSRKHWDVLHTSPRPSAGDGLPPDPGIVGSGTNGDPYTNTDCRGFDHGNPNVCVLRFAARGIEGKSGLIPSGEFVPAYRCPPSHPWLLNRDSNTRFNVPKGVNAYTFNPGGRIEMSITGISDRIGDSIADGQINRWYKTGTLTGFPNSSATNWGLDFAFYQVEILCTNDLANAQFTRSTRA